MQHKTKEQYKENLETGMLVAFQTKEGIKSGKVIDGKFDLVKVEEYSGQLMFIPKESIIWVKTGKRWPKAIFEALRGGGEMNQ